MLVLCLGAVNVALFGGGNAAVANALASGLWAGFLYVGAGVLGVLASTLGQSI